MPNLLISAFDFGEIFKTVVSKWYYYLIAFLVLVALFCFFFFKKQPKRNNLTKTQKLCYTAILTALSVVVNIYDIKISDELQISLLATVCFIAGILLGGGYGFTVGFVGDLLGAIINPHGPYNPIIGLGSGTWGLVFGIAFSFFRGNGYVKTCIAYLICFAVISAGINTVGFCVMYPTRYTFEALLPALPFKLAGVAINCVISCLLLTLFKKILPKSKFTLD